MESRKVTHGKKKSASTAKSLTRRTLRVIGSGFKLYIRVMFGGV